MVKGILFNTEMVRALLDGRKMVTRRVIKKSQCDGVDKLDPVDWNLIQLYEPWRSMTYEEFIKSCYTPPYQPGDILYVRETYCQTPNGQYWYKADNICNGCTDEGICLPKGVQCHKTCSLCAYYDGIENVKWHPSIHMPKEAARIWLRVTDVRVERLQDIMKDPPGKNNQIVREGCTYGCDFIAAWQQTIKKSDLGRYGWDANPWVWVIEFERCEKPKEE